MSYKFALFVVSIFLTVSLSACKIKVGPQNVRPNNLSPATETAIQDQTSPENPSDNTLEGQPEQLSPLKDVYEIGDVIPIGNAVVVVAGWEELPPVYGYPTDGDKVIGVDLILVNRSGGEEWFFYGNSASLVDGKGQEYPEYETNPMPAISAISVSPGERIRGTLPFKVKPGANDLRFMWKEFSNDGEELNAIVELGSQPTSIAIPDSLPGETTRQTSNVGETVQAGGFTVVLNEVMVDQEGDYYKPEPGYKFVFLAVTTTNNASNPERARMRTYIQDSTGRVYLGGEGNPANPSSTGCAGDPTAEHGPGVSICGYIGFEIPIQAEGLTFILEPSWSGTSRANRLYFLLPVNKGGSEITEKNSEFDGDVFIKDALGLPPGFASIQAFPKFLDPFTSSDLRVPKSNQPVVEILGETAKPEQFTLAEVKTNTTFEMTAERDGNALYMQPKTALADGVYCLRFGNPPDEDAQAWCFRIQGSK